VLPSDASPNDLHWLAGLLEGEGSFMVGPPSRPRAPIIALAMTDEDVVARAARLLGCKFHRVVDQREPRWRPAFQLRLSGARAVAWMAALQPLLGARRRAQIDRALASYDPRSVTKLDDDAGSTALALLATGASVKDVAARFNVSVWCIYDLRSGRTHKDLHAPGAAAA
jgi:hypothetical protein